MPLDERYIQMHSEAVFRSIHETRNLSKTEGVIKSEHKDLASNDYVTGPVDVGIQDVHGNTALHYLASQRGVNRNLIAWLRTQNNGEIAWRQKKNQYGYTVEELHKSAKAAVELQGRQPFWHHPCSRYTRNEPGKKRLQQTLDGMSFNSMTTSSDFIPLSDIPTISQLYSSANLVAVTHNEKSFTPSAVFNSKVALIRTSITDLEVTSIVNAANTSLLGGGGVVRAAPRCNRDLTDVLQDGAIHSAAGPDLLEECQTLGGCETGSAKITSAYELPSKYIIHAVGPVYGRERRKREGLQAELLASCYNTSLELAAEKGGSIAFSCLSTGVYGYPSDEAAEIACKTVRTFLESERGQALDRVVFCCFLKKDEMQYDRFLPSVKQAESPKQINKMLIFLSVFFPPTKDDLAASASEPDEPAEEPVNADKQEPELEPVTPQHEDWVKIEKPGEVTELSETSMATFEGNVPQGTNAKAQTAQAGDVVQSNLLKDW
ncbi:MAG: hypothetical protein Q9173_004686 [Seirophora scorigena]